MSEFVERSVSTKGKEENITSMVVFPFNEDDIKERFQVEDLKELCFTDAPDGKMTVKQFNAIMRDAVDREMKLKSQIEAVVKFLKNKMKNYKEYKGVSDKIPLSFEDSLVWKYYMSNYKHKDELVNVIRFKSELSVFYGETKK